MRVSITMPNKSNAQRFNLIYDGCPDTTKDNLDKIKESLKEAKKMYNDKHIKSLTGMEFLDFVNYNDEKFKLEIKEIDFTHIDF